MATCEYIFKRGKNVGRKCNALCKNPNATRCSKHVKSIQPDACDLPDDILTKIFQNVATSMHRSSMSDSKNPCKTLIYLSATSHSFSKLVNNSIWQLAWESFLKNNEIEYEVENLNFKDRIVLLANIGCQFCGKTRIRKVYTEFNVRCCTDCLYDRTVSDYLLENLYNINPNKYNKLSHIRKEMYKYRIGYYTLRFYWSETIENIIGMSLRDYR